MASTAPTRTAPSASTTSAAAQTYTSDRLQYRIRLPLGWTARPGYLDWELGLAPTPGSPFVDTLAAPAGRPSIAVSRQQLPGEETLSEWLVHLQNTKSITYGDLCTRATAEADTTLDAEPAKSLSLRCPSEGPDAVGVQLLALHGRYGYLFMCYDSNWGAARKDELVKHCHEWSTSFAFLPAWNAIDINGQLGTGGHKVRTVNKEPLH